MKAVDSFGKSGASREMRRVIRIIGVGDGIAHDLAAIEVQDQIEIEPAPGNLGWQIGPIPAPDLAGGGSHMSGGRACGPRGLVPAPVAGLAMGPQDPAEGRFTRQIHAFIGPHVTGVIHELRHDPRRRHGCKARLIRDREHRLALGRGQGMGRRCAPGVRASVCADFPFGGLPALERPKRDASERAGGLPAGARLMGLLDVVG